MFSTAPAKTYIFVTLIMLCVLFAIALPFTYTHTAITPSVAHAADQYCYAANLNGKLTCEDTLASCQAAREASGATGPCNLKKDRDWWDIGGHLWDVLDRFLGVILGTLLALAGGILAFAGIFFDTALEYTVTDFGESFKAIEPGVNAAWSGFRDVANIVMIGLYVFVAFAVILNVEEYGLRRLGARIIVVALLINFSLFFTKAIVDVSNITATQFRQAITVVDSKGVETGISGFFMEKAGLSGSVLLGAIDETTRAANTSWANAFIYVGLSGLLFLALASLFLAATFLLVKRMVILIILMITAAPAFIAYMIPATERYWYQWWNMLFINSLLAPVFMIMMWATFLVLQNLGGQSFKIVDLLNNSASAWSVVMQLSIIFGLFYASLKISFALSGEGDAPMKAFRRYRKRYNKGAKWMGKMGNRVQESGLYRSLMTRALKAVRGSGESEAQESASRPGTGIAVFNDQSIDKALENTRQLRHEPIKQIDLNPLGGGQQEDASFAATAANDNKQLDDFQKVMTEAVTEGTSAAREEKDTPTTIVSAPDSTVTTTPEAPKAANDNEPKGPSKEKQNELKGAAEDIKGLADAINKKKQGVLDTVPTSDTAQADSAVAKRIRNMTQTKPPRTPANDNASTSTPPASKPVRIADRLKPRSAPANDNNPPAPKAQPRPRTSGGGPRPSMPPQNE